MYKPLLITGIFCLLACSFTSQQATINLYVDPTFMSGQIKKLAILPIKDTNLPGYKAKNLNRDLIKEFQSKNPNIELMLTAKSSRELNKHQLTDDWDKFLDKYVLYGRPDTDLLSFIGSKLGVDAIMQGETTESSQQDGQYRVQTAITRITVKYRIFDIRRGKLLWEGSSEGFTERELTFEDAPPVAEAAKLAFDKIIENLPRL